MTIVRSGPVSGQGIDKLFGFESIVEESLSNTSLAAGANALSGTAVGTGKVWKITQVAIVGISATMDSLRVTADGLAGGMVVLDQLAPVNSQWYTKTVELYLQAGDLMSAMITDATAGDDLYFRYSGVQMNAP